MTIDYGEPLTAEEIYENNPSIDSMRDARVEVHYRQRERGKLAESLIIFGILFLSVISLVLLLA